MWVRLIIGNLKCWLTNCIVEFTSGNLFEVLISNDKKLSTCRLNLVTALWSMIIGSLCWPRPTFTSYIKLNGFLCNSNLMWVLCQCLYVHLLRFLNVHLHSQLTVSLFPLNIIIAVRLGKNVVYGLTVYGRENVNRGF